MKIDNQKILVAIVALTLLLFPVVAFTTGVLRVVLGMLFVIFSPGYALLSAIFPKRNGLSGIERVALSFGTSIAIVPLIGIILNFTPWGIRLYPILISVSLFIIIVSAIACYRQLKLPPDDRLSITLNLPDWASQSMLERGLSIALLVAIVASLAGLGYAIAKPQQENFTEFYILGSEGKFENYPKEVLLGDPIEISLVIVNHEHQPTSYRVEIKIGDILYKEISTEVLNNEGKWQEKVSFVPQLAGEKQKVEFWLYKDDQQKPYYEQPLHLYVDVKMPH